MTSILLTVFRYILQNPVKAGLSSSVFDYPWSSWKACETSQEYPVGLTDVTYISALFHKVQERAIKRMKEFLQQPGINTCLDIDTIIRLTNDELRQRIKELYPEMKYHSLNQLSKDQRNEALQKIKSIQGAGYRQIARITGMGIKIVQHA